QTQSDGRWLSPAPWYPPPLLLSPSHSGPHRGTLRPVFPVAKFPVPARPPDGESASCPNAPAETNAENIPRRKNIACTDRAPSARTPLHPAIARYASADATPPPAGSATPV